MDRRIFTYLTALILCFCVSESKAQQEESPDKPPIRIEKGGTINDIPGRNIDSLQTNIEIIESPQQQVITNFPPATKRQKSSEEDYTHKRILLQGESIIFAVNGSGIYPESSNFEVFSPEIEAAIKRTPAWLHDDLRFKFRLMTDEAERTKMVNLLNSTEKKYLDEVAFALAHLPQEVLKSSRFAKDWNYLLENAKMIYAYADSLKYVRLVEEGNVNSDDWSTTAEYKIKQKDEYIWRKIDKYYYYMFIVMPKLQQEGVFVTDNTSSTDQRTWGYGWRDYLWNNPSPIYTNVNRVTSVATIKTIPRLGTIMQQPDYLWDENCTWFPFNREFKTTDHAMNILGNWASKCIPMDVTSSSDYRPSQPNQIAWKHVGNCHEDALLVAAAARTSLIPLMHISDNCDDHVWGMFHDANETDTWHHFEFFRGGATPLGDSRQQYWGMTNMQRYAGYGWTSSLVQGYVPDGTMINVSDFYSKVKPSARIQLKVTDKDGNPVDGARVQIYSTNTQYGTKYILSAGYLWTDSRGEINEPVGTGKEYYFKISHPKFGTFPDGTSVYEITKTNTTSGKTYSYNYGFTSSPERTTITVNRQEFESKKSIDIDFSAKNITTGVNPSDWQRSTFYDKTGTDAYLTAYIVKESEIEKFRKGDASAVAEYSISPITSGQHNIPVFENEKTYIVLTNNCNLTNAVELFYTLPPIGLDLPDYTVYPNPALDIITVVIPPEKMKSSYKITLIDANGRIVKSIENHNVISIIELNAGMYFVKIECEGAKPIEKKFVKK
jgi:hypothetical protein